MEGKEEMEASQERAEKVRKRREVDDKGGKILMDKAMKKARLGASDDEEGETPKSQGRGRTSAASHIAAAKQRAAELHLERTERRLEVQREIELERLSVTCINPPPPGSGNFDPPLKFCVRIGIIMGDHKNAR